MQWDYVREKSQNEGRVALNERKVCGEKSHKMVNICTEGLQRENTCKKTTRKGNLEQKSHNEG